MTNYNKLVKELRHYFGEVPLVLEATNAIEELQQQIRAINECHACRIVEKDGILELSIVPRWISVKERLPEDHDRVLVVNDDGKMITAERAEGDWWYTYCAYDVDRWDSLENGVITHWMPLPSAEGLNDA